MKYIISINICFIIVTTFCYGQETSKDQSPLYIKTNLTHYVTGQAFFSIEKSIKKIRPEIGFSIIYPFRPWMNAVTDNPIVSDKKAKEFYSHGYSITIQNKFLFKKSQNGSCGYFSPLFMFKYISRKDVSITYSWHHDPVTYETYLTTDKKNIYALKFLIGYEEIIKNKVMIDFYTGLGWRVIYLYDSYSKWVEDPYQTGYEKQDDGHSYSLTFHMGLNIGFNIIKKNKYSG